MNPDHENLITASAIAVAILCVSATTMFGCHQVESTRREAIKAGLVEDIKPGLMSPVWSTPTTPRP